MAKFCVKCLLEGKRVTSYSRTKLCEEHRMERLREKNLYELPLKALWKSLYGKCYSPGWSRYSPSRAGGFTMCEEWKTNPDSFYKWAIENGYVKGKLIKIKQGCKEYSTENCYVVGGSE